MDIFSVLSMTGGLALFLFGMHTMGQGLEKASGTKMKNVLEKMTDSTLKGLLLGTGVTAVIQSSSATTVMVVGFVNSGLMNLRQAVRVIMGANIGTTVTSWLLSLTGIESDNVFIKLLKPSSFSPIFAIVGVVLLIFINDSKKKDIGSILIGFAVLMTGMDTMSKAVAGLSQSSEFANMLTMFSNPLLGILSGAVITAVLQSSSASVGILQALSVTGGISYQIAIPIIMGQNIGTCVTTVISAIGANKNAKRASFIHLYFNVIGCAFFFIIFAVLLYGFNMPFLSYTVNPADIAVIHTVFNVVSTLVLLPFTNQLESLASISVKDKKQKAQAVFIDERLLETPAIAVAQCTANAEKMARLCMGAFEEAINLLKKYDKKSAESVLEKENLSDVYEDMLGTYSVKLSSKDLGDSDSREISKILLTINDFERIADHAANVVHSLSSMREKDMRFSPAAVRELEVISSALKEILQLACTAFINNDLELAGKVAPLDSVISRLLNEIKSRHINRLKAHQATIERGYIHLDLLTSFKRVTDHCSNVAVCVIQINKKSFETHEYLKEIQINDDKFKLDYNKYREKFLLPQN